MTALHATFDINRGSFDLQVDLTLPDQGVTALFGPSGCGKTTLLRAIAGLDRHGNGLLKTRSTVWQDDSTFVPPHRRSLGYVFQEASLFPHLNVRQNIEYGYKRSPENDRSVSLDNTIALMGLENLLVQKPNKLSGGERQRAAIAQALVASPKLLLMDEPLTALDNASKQEIIPYLETLKVQLNIPMVYVSHTVEEVARLADNMILMNAGRITARGATQEMLTRLDIDYAYENDATSIVEGTVSGHDEPYQLTYIKCGSEHFTIPYRTFKIGSPVRLRLKARDLSITLERPTQSSILNIFPATVDSLAEDGTAQANVRLLLGENPILARITRKSVAHLNLKPGKHVFLQVKSVSLQE